MKKFLFLFLFSLLLLSCARVGSPVGGDKDTLAPKFLRSNIDTPRVNVPRNLKELRLDFDEYITLKDINKQLNISPPIKKIKKIIPSGMANKYILIQWEDTLQENTTYNFNFGNAIQDNNEGNVLPYFNYAFSTGEKIDDLYISGTISHALKKETPENKKERNYVVGLYLATPEQDFKQKPYYISKVDDDGYFELNYLSKGEYYILGFNDENQNSVFDAGKEDVAFKKEKIDLLENISGLQLKLYPSKKSVSYKEIKAVPGGLLVLYEGNPEKINITPLSPEFKNYKVTHRKRSDSAFVLFNAQKENIGVAQSANLKFETLANDSIKKEISIFYKANTKDELIIVNDRANLLVPQQDFRILANMDLQSINSSQWVLKQDSIIQKFNAKISEQNPREIKISSDFKPGKKYSLTVPKESVSSYFYSTEKSYQFNFEGDKEENYGSLTLNIQNKPTSQFWVQLLDAKHTIMYSKYSQEEKVQFSMVKPGTYQLRILVDNNENGFWDVADFKNQSFAEDVYLFPKNIEIRQLWEIVETWDLKTNQSVSALKR